MVGVRLERLAGAPVYIAQPLPPPPPPHILNSRNLISLCWRVNWKLERESGKEKGSRHYLEGTVALHYL